jgi:hypothetical protein
MPNSINKILWIASAPAKIQTWFIPNTARCVMIGLNGSDGKDDVCFYVIYCKNHQEYLNAGGVMSTVMQHSVCIRL